MVALGFPLNPALQEQPLGTLTPLLNDGHAMAMHDPLKNGVIVVPTMVPEKPALHTHPLVPKLSPLELAGHVTVRQLLL